MPCYNKSRYGVALMGKNSKILVSQYPFEMMCDRSNVLHDLDIDLAVRKVAG